MLRADGFDAVNASLKGWLEEATRAGSGDDTTVAIICRMDALEKPEAAKPRPRPATTDAQARGRQRRRRVTARRRRRRHLRKRRRMPPRTASRAHERAAETEATRDRRAPRAEVVAGRAALRRAARDYCGEYRREVSVLVSALEEHVPRTCSPRPRRTPREVLLARLARRLCDNLALSEAAAALGRQLVGAGPRPDLRRRAEGHRADAPRRDAAQAARQPLNGAALLRERPRPAPSTRGRRAPHRRLGATAAAITRASARRSKHAAPGARILVRPGVYDESVVLDKPVEIVGDGPREKIIVRSADASCSVMRRDRARVAGLTLRGEAGGGDGFFAVDIPRGSLLLEDCDISSDTLSCVAVHGATAAPLDPRLPDPRRRRLRPLLLRRRGGRARRLRRLGNANVGVAVTGGASPTVRRSKISRRRERGHRRLGRRRGAARRV